MIKNFFARIWALWAMVTFLSSMLIIYLPFLFCSLLKEPKRSSASYQLFKGWMRIFLPMVGVRIHLKGLEYFEKGRNYVIVCNHSSFMDIPVSTTKVPGPNKTIAKIEMSRIPVFGYLYSLGAVLVDRRSKKSRLQSYLEMKKVVEMGMHMLIYPEGTRNKSNAGLLPFHDGAFNLAVDTQTPLIPAILKGANRVLPSNKLFYFLPGCISFEFLPPLSPGSDAGALKSKTYTLMMGNLMEKETAGT
jgi:1-acyl-sn-glycerol-3-phosphate acyltransferase